MNLDSGFDLKELLLNFQSALRAIVPMAEKIGITWKNDEAYDDWENIEDAMFSSMVATQCIYEIDERNINEFIKYKSISKNIFKYSYITHFDGKMWLFVGLKTMIEPFDSCLLQEFDKNTGDTKDNFKTIPFNTLNPCVEINKKSIVS